MERVLRRIGWRRVLVTAACVLVWRSVSAIPLAGLDLNRLGALFSAQAHTGSLLAGLGSSEPFAQYSVGALGVTPYIDAIVIMTLAAAFSRRVREMRRSRQGLHRLRLWTRALALGQAALLADGSVHAIQRSGLLPDRIPWFTELLVASEITAGTAVLIAVADVMDEYGLGLGFGPIWIYALGPLVFETHRLAALITTAPSIEALYLPALVWIAASIAIAAVTVAAASAYRLVASQSEEEDDGSPRIYAIGFLVSGVLRPAVMTFPLLNLPGSVALLFYSSNPDLANVILRSWLPDGPNPWWSAAYLGTEAVIILGATWVAVLADSSYWLPGSAAPHLSRLTLLSGLFLVLTVVLIPKIELLGSSLAGHALPMSGFDAVLVVALLFAAVRRMHPLPRRRAIQIPAPAFP